MKQHKDAVEAFQGYFTFEDMKQAVEDYFLDAGQGTTDSKRLNLDLSFLNLWSRISRQEHRQSDILCNNKR